MTATTETSQDLAKAEAALDVLLRAIAEQEAKQPATPIKATPFVWYDDESIPTRAEIEVKSLLHNTQTAAPTTHKQPPRIFPVTFR